MTEALPEPERLLDIRGALDPRRWALLTSAMSRGPFRADEARGLMQSLAAFEGSESTARFHATWLADRGYLSETKAGGRLEYSLTDRGRALVDHIRAAATGTTEGSRSATESRLVALVAYADSDEYEILAEAAGAGDLDLAAELRSSLQRVLTARARIRIDRA